MTTIDLKTRGQQIADELDSGKITRPEIAEIIDKAISDAMAEFWKSLPMNAGVGARHVEDFKRDRLGDPPLLAREPDTYRRDLAEKIYLIVLSSPSKPEILTVERTATYAFRAADAFIAELHEPTDEDRARLAMLKDMAGIAEGKA